MTHRQEILGAVYNCPQALPHLFKSYNKQLLHNILHDLLPRRIGLEFECSEFILLDKIDEITLKAERRYLIDKTISQSEHMENLIASYYNIYSFSAECTNTLFINEHRISILGYTQLEGLHRVLEDMKKNCKFTESGIHIHIDINDFQDNNDSYFLEEEELIAYLRKNLNKVESIFYPKGEKYKGTYNGKTINTRGWIRLQPEFGSVEFRIAPLTFDYTTIVEWLIKLTALIEDTKKHLGLKTKYKFCKRYK